MIHRTVKHIHRFRVYFLAIIIVAFFYQIGIKPVDLGRFVGAKFGSAVGMSISIPDNPFNKLALQLKEKEDLLNVREKELDARENDIPNAGFLSDPTLFFMASGIGILFMLVIFNFYLDYHRRKKNKKTAY